MTPFRNFTALLALAIGATVGNAAVVRPRDPLSTSALGSTSTSTSTASTNVDSFQHPASSTPEPRWGQTVVHLPSHKAAIFLGGRSHDGELLHRAEVLDIFALHQGASFDQAWSNLPMPTGVPATTFASAVPLSLNPSNQTSFVLLGGETDSCDAASAYIWTSSGATGLNGSWSALQAQEKEVYQRSHMQAMLTSNTSGSQQAIYIAGAPQTHSGCASSNVTVMQARKAHHATATTEKWVMDQAQNVQQAGMTVDVTPAPRHIRRDVPVKEYAAVAIATQGNTTDRLLYIGGLTSDQTPISLRHIWSFDVDSGEWARVRTGGHTLGGLYGHTATLMPDNKVVVVGGYQGRGTNRTISSATMILDLNMSPPTWSTLASSPAPGRVFHSAFNVGHKLIVAFGKVDHSTGEGHAKRAPSSSDIMLLNTHTWTWSNKFQESSAVSSASASPSDSTASQSTASPPTHSSLATTHISGHAGVSSGDNSFGPSVGLQSTLSRTGAASATATPFSGPDNGNTANHASSPSDNNSGSKPSGRTLAAILAPTLSVGLALIFWLILVLCVVRHFYRRNHRAADKEQNFMAERPRVSRVISSTGRGVPHQPVLGHERWPIDSSLTLDSNDMFKEDSSHLRSKSNQSTIFSHSYYLARPGTPAEPEPALLPRETHLPTRSTRGAQNLSDAGGVLPSGMSGGLDAVSRSLRSSLRLSPPKPRPTSNANAMEDDKYTAARPNSGRNLQHFRGRASIKRERETARFHAAAAAAAAAADAAPVVAPDTSGAAEPTTTPSVIAPVAPQLPEVACPPPVLDPQSPFSPPHTVAEEPVQREVDSDETAGIARLVQSSAIESSSSNLSAISYPYLRGVPRTCQVPEIVINRAVSSEAAAPDTDAAAPPRTMALNIKRKVVPSTPNSDQSEQGDGSSPGASVNGLDQQADQAQPDSPQSRKSEHKREQDAESLLDGAVRERETDHGWFTWLTSQEDAKSQSSVGSPRRPTRQEAAQLSRTPAGSEGKESLVDPFFAGMKEGGGQKPVSDSLCLASSAARSGASASPVSSQALDGSPLARTSRLPQIAGMLPLKGSTGTEQLSPPLRSGTLGSSARPLPPAPGGVRRTPSAYAVFYSSSDASDRKQSQPAPKLSMPVDGSAPTPPLPAAAPRQEPPATGKLTEARPRTFHESPHSLGLGMHTMPRDQRPVSFHGGSAAHPARRNQVRSGRTASMPYAMWMTPTGAAPPGHPAHGRTSTGSYPYHQAVSVAEGASTTSLPHAGHGTHFAPSVPGSRRNTMMLYAPSEGSRASSPTPSERMFAPEGATGVPPAFLL